MKKLHIITPSVRLNLLPVLFNSILPAREYFDLYWHVAIDALTVPDANDRAEEFKLWAKMVCPDSVNWLKCYGVACEGSTVGKGQLNHVLGTIKSGLVWVLDDDNVPHPDFFKSLKKCKKDIFIVTSRKVACPEIVKEHHIDQAQYVVPRKLIGDTRYYLRHTADGKFIEDIKEKFEDRHDELFEYNTKELAYYNALTSFRFSCDWFTPNTEGAWEEFASYMKYLPIRALEVGCFEGRASTWMLMNLLLHPSSNLVAIDNFKCSAQRQGTNSNEATKEMFVRNIEQTGSSRKVNLVEEPFEEYSLKLPNNSFDFIYLDGDHREESVLRDARECWRLLDEGGILVMDDYGWTPPNYWLYGHPSVAIEEFEKEVGQNATLLRKGYQAIYKKNSFGQK